MARNVKFFPIAASLWLLTASVPAWATPAKDCASQVLERAIKSCTLLLDAPTIDPGKKALYLTLRARAYVDSQQYPAAEKDIAAALAASPNYPVAFGVRGRLNSARDQHAAALDDYNTYLKLSENKFSPLISRGNYFLRVKKLPEAAKDFEAAKALRPTAGASYLGLARVRRLENDQAAARSTVEAGLAVDPANVSLLVERGELRLEKNDAAGAKADFEKALELEPGLPKALQGRDKAVAAATPGEKRQAAPSAPRETKAAATEDQQLAKAAALRGEAKWTEALAVYDALLKSNPKSSVAMAWRGFCLEKLGQHKDAIDAYVAALEARPVVKETVVLATVGVARIALEHDKDYKTAVELTSKALQVDAKDEEGLRIRMVANFKRTRFDASASDAAKLAAIPSRTTEARGWEALALAGAGKLDQALKLSEDLLKADAGNAFAHAAKAWAALQRGQLQTAETESRKAIGSDPESEEAAFVHQLVLLHKALKPTDEQVKANR